MITWREELKKKEEEIFFREDFRNELKKSIYVCKYV